MSHNRKADLIIAGLVALCVAVTAFYVRAQTAAPTCDARVLFVRAAQAKFGGTCTFAYTTLDNGISYPVATCYAGYVRVEPELGNPICPRGSTQCVGNKTYIGGVFAGSGYFACSRTPTSYIDSDVCR